MGKKNMHKEELTPIFDDYIESGVNKRLINYLIKNSNLPGRRANLELAEAFAEIFFEYQAKFVDKLYPLILDLLDYTVKIAPTNDPKEFIAFCGTWALGPLTLIKDCSQEAYEVLKKMANDSRWRIREAVAKAIKMIAINDYKKLLEVLGYWIDENNNWLIMRAIAAGVAEGMLKNNVFIQQSLEFHKKIINKLKNANKRQTEEFKALKKALGFSLSVVVQANPKDGFKYMRQLAKSEDKDIIWIIKNNLEKKRLKKNFIKEVNQVKMLLKS